MNDRGIGLIEMLIITALLVILLMAAVGLTMHERGKSDDKIGNFIIAVQETISRELDAGEDAISIVKKLEEKTGIVLRFK